MVESFLELTERLGKALNAEISVCNENMKVIGSVPDDDLRRFSRSVLEDIYYGRTLPVQPGHESRIAAGQLLGY